MTPDEPGLRGRAGQRQSPDRRCGKRRDAARRSGRGRFAQRRLQPVGACLSRTAARVPHRRGSRRQYPANLDARRLNHVLADGRGKSTPSTVTRADDVAGDRITRIAETLSREGPVLRSLQRRGGQGQQAAATSRAVAVRRGVCARMPDSDAPAERPGAQRAGYKHDNLTDFLLRSGGRSCQLPTAVECLRTDVDMRGTGDARVARCGNRSLLRRNPGGDALARASPVQATEIVHDLYIGFLTRSRWPGPVVQAFLIRAAVNLGIDRARRLAFEQTFSQRSTRQALAHRPGRRSRHIRQPRRTPSCAGHSGTAAAVPQRLHRPPADGHAQGRSRLLAISAWSTAICARPCVSERMDQSDNG